MDDYKQVIAEAIKRIEKYDKIDAKHGSSFPIPLDICLGNVRAALMSGLQTESWDCVADALVMLDQSRDPSKVRRS